MSEPELIDHVLIHVRDALAVDGRVGELGLDVECVDDLVVVRGTVSSPERQVHVIDVAVEVLRAHGCECLVHDATHVPTVEAPHEEPEAV